MYRSSFFFSVSVFPSFHFAFDLDKIHGVKKKDDRTRFEGARGVNAYKVQAVCMRKVAFIFAPAAIIVNRDDWRGAIYRYSITNFKSGLFIGN